MNNPISNILPVAIAMFSCEVSWSQASHEDWRSVWLSLSTAERAILIANVVEEAKGANQIMSTDEADLAGHKKDWQACLNSPSVSAARVDRQITAYYSGGQRSCWTPHLAAVVSINSICQSRSRPAPGMARPPLPAPCN